MSKWQIVKDNAALSPRPIAPGSAISVPGGRVTIDQIQEAIRQKPSLNILNLITNRSIPHSRERNLETIKTIAQKRLQQAGKGYRPEDVNDYLHNHRAMLISGLGDLDRKLVADDFFNDLSPLDSRHSTLFRESMSPISLELLTLFTLEVGKWSVFTADVLDQARAAFLDFKTVVEQQISDDNFWKRALWFCARLAIGIVFGAFGMGFLGNLAGGLVADWLGEVSDNDIFIFNEGGYTQGISGDAYIKTALPDAVKGGVGDLGGWVKDTLWDAAKCDSQFGGEEPLSMIDQLRTMILKVFAKVSEQGRDDLLRTLMVFKERFRTNVAWAVCFELSKAGAPCIDQDLLRALKSSVDVIKSHSKQSLLITVGCPFDQVSAQAVREVIEKVYWALYLKQRLQGSEAKSLGDPIIERLVQLKVGVRRDKFRNFGRTKGFEQEEEATIQGMASIQAGPDRASRDKARMDLKTQEGAIRYSYWAKGEENDKQALQWAKTFLNVNPLEAVFRVNGDFARGTAAGRVDPEAWQKLVDRYNSASAQLKAALRGIT